MTSVAVVQRCPMCATTTVPIGADGCATCVPPKPSWLARRTRRTGTVAATFALALAQGLGLR